MFSTAIFLMVSILPAGEQPEASSSSLLSLLENRAVMKFDYGDKHPKAVKLDSEIANRVSNGETIDFGDCEKRLFALMQQREELKRDYGLKHEQMRMNALRLRAVANVLAGQPIP